VLGAGCWVLGAGCWVLGAGCWVLGMEFKLYLAVYKIAANQQAKA
jgi:hypothetical protein